MRTLIAIPCHDMLHTEFARTLLTLRLEGEVQYTFSQGSLVYDSRNLLANTAIEGGFDRVLWLDSDIVVPPEALRQLGADLAEGREFVSGLYFGRKSPFRPVAYKELLMQHLDGRDVPYVASIDSWPVDRLFTVQGAGFGLAMVTTELLRRVRDNFGLPFSPILGFGEDLSFCLRARELGAEIWIDPRVQAGHIGLHTYTHADWRPEK